MDHDIFVSRWQNPDDARHYLHFTEPVRANSEAWVGRLQLTPPQLLSI